VPDFTNETMTIRDCRVSMLRGGSGAPLVYLHGAGGAGMVLPFMTALAERFEVIVPEHPGFGASDEPDWLDNIHDLAYFYLDFLEALDLGRVHLVGMSLGGWIALEVAVRSTALIETLTLAGPAGIHVKDVPTGDIFTWSPAETFRQGLHDQQIAEKAIASLPETPEADDILLKNRSTVARLAWEPRLHDPHLRKWLHRIDIPTRIVWAEHDRILPPAYADALAALVPGAEVTIIPECGHLLHIEKPADFVAAIEAHVRGAQS